MAFCKGGLEEGPEAAGASAHTCQGEHSVDTWKLEEFSRRLCPMVQMGLI